MAVYERSHLLIKFALDGHIRWLNQRFLNAVGYGLDELAGQHHGMPCDPVYVRSPVYAHLW